MTTSEVAFDFHRISYVITDIFSIMTADVTLLPGHRQIENLPDELILLWVKQKLPHLEAIYKRKVILQLLWYGMKPFSVHATPITVCTTFHCHYIGELSFHTHNIAKCWEEPKASQHSHAGSPPTVLSYMHYQCYI